jgi:CRP-like cAMP-binding protein
LPLFSAKLLSIAREVAFRKGERLVRQGEVSRGAFVIREGEVQAEVALPGGGTLAVSELRSGDMFGEMALIEHGVCMASVVARTDVAGWFIARDDFRAMVAGRDDAARDTQRAITAVLAQKLRAATARLLEHRAAEDRATTPSKEHSRDRPTFDWKPFLTILSFFQGFDPHEVEDLIQGCAVFELPRDASLFNAGQRAEAAFVVLRGAVEIVLPAGNVERRITIAGPGELVGYLGVLEGKPHWASARVRESACLMELPTAQLLSHYEGNSGTSVSLHHAIHRSLLLALARTNAQLARLISHARLTADGGQAVQLEKALHGQIVQSRSLTDT